MAREYDVVILGGGTGGYVAAIRAAQLGLKTALVEKNKVGGTCLHQGCIPSKALLKSAEVFALAKRDAAQFGVEIDHVALNFAQVQARKNAIVERLYTGVQHLMKKGKIDVFEGHGRMLGPSIFSPMPGTISVEMNDGSENEILTLKNVIIATGSRPRLIEGVTPDEEYILTSDGALAMKALPKSIVIIGGGVIGIEWASMLQDFGVEVTVVEAGNRILPTEDEAISKAMQKSLAEKGVQFLINASVLPETVQKTDGVVTLTVEHQNEQRELSAEKVLLSVGRQGNVEDIGIENTSIEVLNGNVQVSSTFQTKEKHIYAIGDVIGGLQLAHVASVEGIFAVEHIKGLTPERVENTQIAKCIYARPEAASVGLTETQAKEQGYDVEVTTFPFQANGKALVNGYSDGFVKLLADKQSNDLLGVHMIGANVTELISEAGLALVLNATPWEMTVNVHPHPSLSEALGEAALAIDGKAIHL